MIGGAVKVGLLPNINNNDKYDEFCATFNIDFHYKIEEEAPYIFR